MAYAGLPASPFFLATYFMRPPAAMISWANGGSGVARYVSFLVRFLISPVVGVISRASPASIRDASGVSKSGRPRLIELR